MPAADRLAPQLRMAPAVAAVAAAFALATHDGGRDPAALAVVQIAVLSLAAALLWTRGSGLGRLAGPVAVMLAAVAAATVLAVRPEAGVQQTLLWTLYAATAVVAAHAGRRHPQLLADGVAAVAGWLCLVALFMFWGSGDPGMRWYATFYWPNPFAAFLLLALPLTLLRFACAARRREVLAHGALALLLAISLVMTYSRGAWLALAAALPLGAALSRPTAPGAIAARLAALAALAALAVALLTGGAPMRDTGQSVGARAASVADTADYAIRGRLTFWRAGLAIFAAQPLLGTGPGSFGVVYPSVQRDVRYYARDPHNLYAQTLAETGVVGAVALAWLLATLAACWRRALRRAQGRSEYAVIAGAGLSLTAFFLHSAVEMNWMFPANPAAAFVLIGLLASSAAGGEPPTEQGRAGKTGARLAAVLSLAAAVSAGALWMGHRAFVAGGRAARAADHPLAAARYAAAARWNPLSARYLDAQAASLAAANPADRRIEPLLRRAMALDRMNAALPLHLARHLLQSGDPRRRADAGRLLQAALRLDRFNRPEAYRLLADLYRREGQLDAAAAVYERAMRLYLANDLGGGSLLYFSLWPQAAALMIDAADLEAERGRPDHAAAILEALLRDDPSAVGAVLRLSEVYLRQGRRAEAVALLRAAASRRPDVAVVRERLRALEGTSRP